ncbi:MAG: hypothetical protein AAGC97_03555 [Planctomycetota bacterium]
MAQPGCMSLLYFLPNAQATDASCIDRFGLRPILPACQRRETLRGPTGGQGALVTATGNPPPLYRADSQTWQQRHGTDAWIGIDHDQPVTPKSLLRSDAVPGPAVVLADGQHWFIPQLRGFDRDPSDGPLGYHTLLDQRMQIDPASGRLRPGAVVSQFAAIWEQAVAIGDHLLQQIEQRTEATLDPKQTTDFIVACLQLNYRVQLPEIDLLGLLTRDLQFEVLKAALDWDGMRSALGNRQGRRHSDGTPSDSGPSPPPPANTTPTDPPSES